MSRLVRYLGTRDLRWRLLYLVRAAFRMAGQGWNGFYAWMLDFQDRKLTLDQILSKRNTSGKFKGLWDWERGIYYCDYLQRHGLKPDHTILDYGCGYGRVTIPVMHYIGDGGHYIGTELSKRRLALTKEWIEREGLSGKSHELIISKDNSMPFVADNSVDVVWVLSVFNHMPDAELETSLASMHRALRPGGTLFCYFLSDIDDGDTSVKTFRRSEADMTRLLESKGFEVTLVTDFDEDLGEFRPEDSRMALAKKKEAAAS